MKYIKYLLLTILLLPVSVFAYEFKCDEKNEAYQYEDEFYCSITGNIGSDYDYVMGSLQLSSNSVLTCNIEEINNGLQTKPGEETNNLTFNYTGVLTSDAIVTYKCKVSSKPTAKIEQLVIPEFKYDVRDDNKDASVEVLRSNTLRIQEYIETPTGDKKSRDTSNPNSRAKIIESANKSDLDFTFSQFKTIYNLSVKYEVDTIQLNVIPNNENASVEIQPFNGHLQVGDNVIDVVVISPDQTTKTYYTFNIKRLKRGEEIYYPERDSSLASLKIDGHPIDFESVITEYKIRLKYDENDIKVTAEAKEDGSAVTISNTSNLFNGSAVEVKVTSEDGSNETIYYIKISKDSPPKDYRNLIYGGAIATALIIVIIIIIITNQKNKGNPLLKRKKQEAVDVPPVEPVAPVETPVAPKPEVQPTVEANPTPQPVEPNNTNINQ